MSYSSDLDVRYNKGQIYALVYDPTGEMVYIGQTIHTLATRWGQHRANVSNPTCQTVLYRFIRTVGIQKIRIELVEKYPCSNRWELAKREKYYINLYETWCNTQMAGFKHARHD